MLKGTNSEKATSYLARERKETSINTNVDGSFQWFRSTSSSSSYLVTTQTLNLGNKTVGGGAGAPAPLTVPLLALPSPNLPTYKPCNVAYTIHVPDFPLRITLQIPIKPSSTLLNPLILHVVAESWSPSTKVSLRCVL